MPIPASVSAEYAIAGARIVRAGASPGGEKVVVATGAKGDPKLAVTELSRTNGTVVARTLGSGRMVGAIAVSPSGATVAFDLDGRLRIWRGDRERTAVAPADRLAAAAWIDDETLVVAAGLVWPPIRILDGDGRERSVVEPRLPDAPAHRPCLASSRETGAIAFGWVWSDVAVVADVTRPDSQIGLSAGVEGASLALGIWFGTHGRSVVVAPWPDTKSAAPMDLFSGVPDQSSALEPLLRIPCAAAIALEKSSNTVIAAPIERPGHLARFGPGDRVVPITELPGRIWGVHLASDGKAGVAWTEDTVFWLDDLLGG